MATNQDIHTPGVIRSSNIVVDFAHDMPSMDYFGTEPKIRGQDFISPMEYGVKDEEEQLAYVVKRAEFIEAFNELCSEFTTDVQNTMVNTAAELVEKTDTGDVRGIRAALSRWSNSAGLVAAPFVRLGNYETSGYLNLIFRWERQPGFEGQVIVVDFFYSTNQDRGEILSRSAFGERANLFVAYLNSSILTDDYQLFAPLAEIRESRFKFLEARVSVDTLNDSSFSDKCSMLFDLVVFKLWKLYMVSWKTGTSDIMTRKGYPDFNVKKWFFFIPNCDKVTDNSHLLVHFVGPIDDSDPVESYLSEVHRPVVPISLRESFLLDLFWRKDQKNARIRIAKSRVMLNHIINCVQRAETFAYFGNSPLEVRQKAATVNVRRTQLGSKRINYFPQFSPFQIIPCGGSNTRFLELFDGFDVMSRTSSERRSFSSFKLDRDFFNKLEIGVVRFYAYGYHDPHAFGGNKSSPLLWSGEDYHALTPDCVTEDHVCKLPWFQLKDGINRRLRDEGRYVAVQKKEAMYFSLNLLEENVLINGQRKTQRVGSHFAFICPPGATHSVLMSMYISFVKKELGQLLARALVLHIENLIFDMPKYDYEGWKKLVRDVIGLQEGEASVRQDVDENGFFAIICPSLARRFMTDHPYFAKQVVYFNGTEGKNLEQKKRSRSSMLGANISEMSIGEEETCPVFKQAKSMVVSSSLISSSLGSPVTPGEESDEE